MAVGAFVGCGACGVSNGVGCGAAGDVDAGTGDVGTTAGWVGMNTGVNEGLVGIFNDQTF